MPNQVYHYLIKTQLKTRFGMAQPQLVYEFISLTVGGIYAPLRKIGLVDFQVRLLWFGLSEMNTEKTIVWVVLKLSSIA